MPLKKAVLSKNAAVIRFMFANDFSPDPHDELLHLAVSDPSPDREVVELLLSRCNVNQTRFNGDTPLHLVRDPKIAQVLLQSGADSGIRNNSGKLPHQLQTDEKISALLKADYEQKHAAALRDSTPRAGATDWNNRFSNQLVSLHELVPCGGSLPQDQRFNYQGEEFTASRRFYNSLARKMKFSTNIFNYFSPEEVLDRIAEKAPSTSFVVTFDHHENTMLGVVDENKKMLPVSLACQIFSSDPRTREVSYHNGIWQAELDLNEQFHKPQAGEYFRKLKINYPVDGVGMPCIYLAVMRMVCQNGAVAQTGHFRTDIEINDESGLHLSRLLRSFNNASGFSALEERLEIAAQTTASVNELLKIDRLLMNSVSDRYVYQKLHNRLEEIAGDPCINYGTTSLNNIAHKRRSLLPVDCSVNDLLNFCSELTTHHSNLLDNPSSFDIAAGETLAGELDLEGMYTFNRPSPAFYLDDLDLPKWRTRTSREILESSEVVNG